MVNDILAVDRLEVLVVVDNATDSLSTNPDNVVSEWSGLLTGGRMRLLSGRGTCCAHHGLALLIAAQVGSATHTVLFDAGPDGDTFLRNAAVLGVDFPAIDAVVLSHGHWDHAGGLVAAIESISARRAADRVECYVHPGMFAERALRLPNGELLAFESIPSPEMLARAGAEVISTREPRLIAGGAFYLSGEVPRVTKYETGLPGHVRRNADGGSWEPDPLIMDERFVSVHVKGKGQFVFSACSHAGLINVLTHARTVFPALALHGVLGGLHLSGATENIIPQTLEDLQSFALKLIAPAHCTGWRAVSAMAKMFGGALAPSAVGKRYIIGGDT